jgi:conflict system pore-forming effector with SLATT domain
MFPLSLVDHLRLTFGHVIYSHKAHARAAERQARLDRSLKAGEVLLLLATAICAVSLLFTLHVGWAIAAAAGALAAAVLLVVRLALDLERSSSVHRACSADLWRVREQYRALLADLNDGVLTADAVRQRRDALMTTLHDIYEQAPPADQAAYQSARESLGTLDETVLSDEEIDRFLPRSLQKTGNA